MLRHFAPMFRTGSTSADRSPAQPGRVPKLSRSRRRRQAMRHLAAGEHLEQRALMSVNGYTQSVSGVLTQPWVTLVSDGNDDLYATQVSPASSGQTEYVPSLLYANNSSFLDYREIADIDQYEHVLVTNGAGTRNVDLLGRVQTADNYPFIALDSYKTYFVLPTDDIDGSRPITGTLTNGVGGSWTFTNNSAGTTFASSNFTAEGTPAGPSPVSARIFPRGRDGVSNSGSFDLIMEMTWDTNTLTPGGLQANSPPLLKKISYDFNSDPVVEQRLETTNAIFASSVNNPSFQLPIPAGVVKGPNEKFEVVPGSLSGTVTIRQWQDTPDSQVPRFEFTTLGQFASTLVFRQAVVDGDPNEWATEATFTTISNDDVDVGGGDERRLTGRLVYDADGRPQIQLQFENANAAGGGSTGGGTPAAIVPQEVGMVTVDATYAIFNQPEVGKGDFTLFAGHDFTRRLTVDLLAPGASINLDSPVVYEAGVSPAAHSVDLRASNIYVNANVYSNTSLTVSNSQYGQAKAEQVFFNAANAAQTYDLRVEDDPLTTNIGRSKVFVSATGTLAGRLPTSPNVVPVSATSVFVLAKQGDVFVEGTISGTNQSYLLQSAPESSSDTDTIGLAHRAPYYLSTKAQISGAATGKIRGSSITVTLGNDVPGFYVDAQNGGATARNIVYLNTDIDSLRVRAANRAGDALRSPFPYELDVIESNTGSILNTDTRLRVDALAASSLPIAVEATDDITFNASLASASDVSISSVDGNVVLNAPLSTIYGSISIAANELSVLNSVRVLDSISDENEIDISLTSRAGDLKLVGPITAVNGIQLTQANKSAADIGKIYGDSRVVADSIRFTSEGTVDLRTATRAVSGVAAISVTINESDSLIVTDMQVNGGLVAITANGYDTTTTDENGDPVIVPALQATMSDIGSIYASSPNGSVDVRVNSSEKLIMGNASDIVARKAVSMAAAGEVRISSLGGSVDILDAPVAGLNATAVRAASTGSLAGAYLQRNPGTLPSTLTGLVPGRLVVDGVAVAARDLVLVKDQGNAEENGVYVVVSTGTTRTPWLLARWDGADTSAELVVNRRFRVLEGSQQGVVYRADSYADDLGTTPRSVTAVLNRSDAYAVRAVSTVPLSGVYDLTEDQITSGSTEALPLFDGVRLNADDLVLVRQGVRDANGVINTACNGVYRVTSTGSDLTTWELTKVDDFDTGLVVSIEGTLRAALTGSGFDVRYDSLGNAGLTFVEDAVATKIGSDDVNDTVTFIVSTNLGTNSSTGSLGKMLALAASNSYMVPADPFDPIGSLVEQKQTLQFASTLGGQNGATAGSAIKLTQELPRIHRKLVINGNGPRVAIGGTGSANIVIDGSGINTSRSGRRLAVGERYDGIVFAERVDGSGAADGSVVAGVQLAGFTRGAAVKVDSVDGVLIDNVRIGLDALSRRVGSATGVEIVSSSGFTTVSNSSILASTLRGVSVDGASSSVRIVGSTIGATRLDNQTGVYFKGGTNFLGLPSSNASVRRVSVTTTANQAGSSFRLPAGFPSLGVLYEGLAVSGSRINVTDGDVARIASITTNAQGVSVVTIVGGEISAGPATLQVDFGVYATIEEDSREMSLPVGLVPDGTAEGLYKNLFIGQSVSGEGIDVGTVIQKIDVDGGTITLSKPAKQSGVKAITFGEPGRNTVAFNYRGVVLDGGVNRILNTDISSSVFDGIVVNAGTQAIGGGLGKIGANGVTDAKASAFASNTIFGNGAAGVRIGPNLTSAQVIIRGNRLGVTASNSSSPNKGGNIVGPVGIVNETVAGSYVAAGVNSKGINIVTVTMPRHGLTTGQRVYLEFQSGGLTSRNSAGFIVTRVDSDTFTVNTSATPSADGTLRGYRYGAVSRATQLKATNQFDFEGNQHGVSTDAQTATSSGGVIGGGAGLSRPVVLPRRR
jgi:hypothetical protein